MRVGFITTKSSPVQWTFQVFNICYTKYELLIIPYVMMVPEHLANSNSNNNTISSPAFSSNYLLTQQSNVQHHPATSSFPLRVPSSLVSERQLSPPLSSLENQSVRSLVP